MKTIKYLMAGALMVISSSAFAQESIDDAVNAIKSGNDPKSVEAIVKKVYKANKKNAEGIAQIGRAYLNVGDTANTRKYGELANQAEMKLKTGKTGAGFLLLGDLEVTCDNSGKAAENYEQAIYANPSDIRPYKRYAFVYRGKGAQKALTAAQSFEKYREVDPTYPIDGEKGHLFYQSGKEDAECIKLAYDSYSKVPLADFSKLESGYMTEYALVAFVNQQFAKSREVAEYGLQSKPRSSGYNRLALYNSVELKDYDNAIKYVDKLFNQSDSLVATANDYKYAALAYTGAGNYDEAIKYTEKQLDASEGDAKIAVLKQLASTYEQKKDYDNAIAKYKQYLEEKKDASANDWAGLANMYRHATAVQDEAGQKQSILNAVDVYKQMVTKFPNAADYSNFMAARTIMTLDPDQKQGLAAPFYQGLYDSITTAGAKDDQDKARLTEACQYLGIYYFKIKNNTAAAKKYMQTLQGIDPNNTLAKQILGA